MHSQKNWEREGKTNKNQIKIRVCGDELVCTAKTEDKFTKNPRQTVKFYNTGNKTCGHIKDKSNSDRFRLEYLMKMPHNEDGQRMKAFK